ncbi:MAG: cytochrome c oxidase assembly protein [Bradyrhizobium sp.]|uniref:cytochrome c oxidase assembly protein n=1 Tax=Bradyrhizobium sp. TaxID=376 RepID=UPI0025C6CD66|nr:cytochrome c oxidase assembly protein [Bradyrhizobium sp.]MCA3578270.1 cytochrome c oxidase assembly protein [Bradyrhizobium sp.]
MSTAAAPNNLRTAIYAGLGALAMLGLAYASVPLYRLFCQVTGFGGTTQKAELAELPLQPTNSLVSVRFDGNVNGMPWRFLPEKTHETVRIGEKRIAYFRATNTGATPVTGTASFNVSPDTAGQYFNKIQCFCFTEQTIQPGQTIEFPVVYFVDPAILDDPDGRRIDEITLSYTFFPVDKPEGQGQKTTTAARAGSAAPKQG